MHITLFFIPPPSNFKLGFTVSLPKRSSIRIGLVALLLAFPSLKSSIEGTCKIGILYFSRFSKIF